MSDQRERSNVFRAVARIGWRHCRPRIGWWHCRPALLERYFAVSRNEAAGHTGRVAGDLVAKNPQVV